MLTGGSYILSATFGRKNFLTILKNKEIVRTMIKKERERQNITCEKKNYRGDVIKTFKAFDLPTELITMCFEMKSTVSDFKSPNGHKTWWVMLTTTLCRQTRSSSLKSWGYSTKCRHISALSLHTKDATVN